MLSGARTARVRIMSKTKPAPLPPDTLIGGYRVICKLAAGGFGIVYLAIDASGQKVQMIFSVSE